MAGIDVSDVLLDRDFATRLTIYRRSETIGQNGRTTIGGDLIEPKPYGVILPVDSVTGGQVLERSPDAQHRGSAYVIHTKFRLRGPAPGYQPDVVMIEDDPFVVTIVNAFSPYGKGFVVAEVSAMSAVDNPPS